MAELVNVGVDAEPSKVVADRVAEARARQAHRLAGTPWRTNGEVPGSYLRGELSLPAEVTAAVYAQVRTQALTIRGADRVLRVAWSIADLTGHGRPRTGDVRTALELRLGSAA